MVDANGDIFPVLSDHLNTPRQIIDSQNQLRWRWDNSDPFGNNAPDSNPQGLGEFTYNLRFPGQYFDLETGLHYNYFRDYDPQHGRYLQSDPIGLRGGLNTYGYVGGNPISLTDPYGLTAIPVSTAGPIAEPLTAFCMSNSVVCGVVGAGAAGYEAGSLIYPIIAEPLGDVIDKICRDDPTEEECKEEWDWAYRECEKLINDPIEQNNWRRVGKRPPTLQSCAMGYVSQKCGGNRVD